MRHSDFWIDEHNKFFKIIEEKTTTDLLSERLLSDNITEKVEKIIFGKFVAVTLALVLKNQLKQHTGGQPLSDGCYFL